MTNPDPSPVAQHTISLYFANTRSGEYDPSQPLPYPLHCDPNTGQLKLHRAGYAAPQTVQPELTQVIGFLDDPDGEPEDVITWRGGDIVYDPDCVVGLFPVVCDTAGDFWPCALPVRSVSIDGVPARAGGDQK